MSSQTQVPQKLGFFQKLNRAIERMEKTETDYLWDSVRFLNGRIEELDAELKALKANSGSN